MREKYDTSTMVKVTRRGRLRVRNGRDTIPTANDLVYLSQSPDYCQANATIGTLGKLQSISYSHLEAKIIAAMSCYNACSDPRGVAA